MEQRPEPTDKRDWRDQMRARRRGVPPLLRLAEGRRAAVHLACWPSLPRNSMVATYLSLPDEFPTDSVNSALQEQGCRLAVPAWSVQEKFYRFASWRPKEPLMAGPMRVPEPRLKRWIPTETIALFLVPGLAFDETYGTMVFGVRSKLLGLDANAGASVTVGQKGGNDATFFLSVGSKF